MAMPGRFDELRFSVEQIERSERLRLAFKKFEQTVREIVTDDPHPWGQPDPHNPRELALMFTHLEDSYERGLRSIFFVDGASVEDVDADADPLVRPAA